MFFAQTVAEVAAWRLCLGCGGCSYICPEKSIRLVDFMEEGIRPVVDSSRCGSCSACLDVCPAYENDHTEINGRLGVMPELTQYCGPVLEIWEGFATDDAVRFRGASGGAITALSLFALEQAGAAGVLHVGIDTADALRNRTKLSRTREEVMSRAGSRYAPASACDSLHLIEQADGPCLFVGQPSEVTALRKAQKLRPTLAAKIALALSFFCAGTPSRQGTHKLIESLGVAPQDVTGLRYRGHGWPGHFVVESQRPDRPTEYHRMTYAESWGFIQAYRPFSTHLCPDGTGEDADISCGDPWHEIPDENARGSSLLVVRTEAGRQFLRQACAAGYLELRPAESWKLLKSQENLWAKRGAIGGRIAALEVLGLPTPRLAGFALWSNWRGLPVSAQLRSFFGTIRRCIARRYHRPLSLRPPPVKAGTPSESSPSSQ